MVAAVVGFVLVGAIARAETDPIVLKSLEIRPGTGYVSVILSTDRPFTPKLRALRTREGILRRLYLDLPRGTRVGRGIPRIAPGSRPIRHVGLGLAGDESLRVMIDLEGDSVARIRRLPNGPGVAIVVASHPADPEPPDDATEPRPPVTKGNGGRPLRVVLDPGHGGDDPGASGSLEEKLVTLAIAREVAALLEERLGAQVFSTRSGDETVPLAMRTRRANALRGDLLVSIHANASPRPRTRGIETYYLDNTEDHATLRLVAMENGGGPADRGSGTSLDYILSSLVQGGKQDASRELAERIQQGVVRRLQRRWSRVIDLGVKRGPFYVLVGAYMPCVLVETSFLTHPEEGRRLGDPTYRRAIAEGIYQGIASFAATRGDAGTL